MKKIIIDEEVLETVSYVISLVAREAQKQDFIDALILTSYEYKEKEIVELNFIHSNEEKATDFVLGLSEHSDIINNLLGVNSVMRVEKIENYSMHLTSIKERKAARNGVSGKILFDKNNHVKGVADYCKSVRKIAPYSNLIELEPEIELFHESKQLLINRKKRTY